MSEYRGALVTVDGPGGVGKSTVVRETADYLRGVGFPAHSTVQPSHTEIGLAIRRHADNYRAMALACLVAGDRHHQQVAEIEPELGAGQVVLCDRYLPTSLVLQVIDGVAAEKIWQLNEGIRVPDVAVRTPAQQRAIYRVGARLRPLRLVAGYGVDEFADRLGWTTQKARDTEAGRRLASPVEIAAWCTHADASIDACAELIPLARLAADLRRRARRNRTSPTAPARLRTVPGRPAPDAAPAASSTSARGCHDPGPARAWLLRQMRDLRP